MSEIYLGTPPPGVVSWCEKKFGPMTIECLEDGTEVNIRLTGTAYTDGTFQVQLNNGGWKDVSWEDIGSGKDYNLVNAVADKSSMAAGDTLKFRNIDKWGIAYDQYASLKITGSDAKVYGNLVQSLTPEFAASNQQYKLANFFKESTGLKDASGLDLDGIALADGCYDSMFLGCSSLVNAPALPATTLASDCYISMFSGCTSLVDAPQLPATALADSCYEIMFYNCISLVNAPELPATTLASSCYFGMFLGCSSLVNAPALPATTLAGSCYNNMFSDCTKITELHYPASIETDSTFQAIAGKPKFGARNATAYFDL